MSAPREKTKTPGIYRRGSRYSFTYRDNRGATRWGSAGTLAEAKAKRAALTADVARGEYRAFSTVTFGEYAPEWIATYTGRTRGGVGPDTLADYRRALGLRVDAEGQLVETGDGAIAHFGRLRLAEVEPRDLRSYAAALHSRGFARDTIRLRLAPVKALLATAAEDGLIRSNPGAGLRNLIPADVDREADEPVKALREEELAALLDALPARWRPFFIFLAETGLRFGEAIEARYGDLDLGEKRLHVQRRYYRGRVGLPKGRKRRRVPLSEEMARSFWPPRDADELLFTSEQGQRIDHSNLMRRVLKPAAILAGLGEYVDDGKGGRRIDTWVGFHTLRHTRATTLFRSGWNAVQVQMFLGHTDPGFTLRRYVHLLDDDLPTPDALGSKSTFTTGAEEPPLQSSPSAVVMGRSG
jgi:integrase